VINQNAPNAKQKDLKFVMILVEIVKNVSNFISLFLMRKPLKKYFLKNYVNMEMEINVLLVMKNKIINA